MAEAWISMRIKLLSRFGGFQCNQLLWIRQFIEGYGQKIWPHLMRIPNFFSFIFGPFATVDSWILILLSEFENYLFAVMSASPVPRRIGNSAVVLNQSAIAPTTTTNSITVFAALRIDSASISPSNTRASNISSQSGVSLIFVDKYGNRPNAMHTARQAHDKRMTDHLCTQMV